jgi:hypothetical protein
MKTIQIEYRFLWFTRRLNGAIPASWEEITPRQLIAIARNYLSESSDDELLSILCGVRKNTIRKLDAYQLFSLAGELSFLSDYKPFSHFIIHRAGSLQAPKPRLEGMSFGQFMFVDSYYSIWLSSQKDADLNKFIAALYLPEGEVFQSVKMPARENVAASLPLMLKLAISINYRLIREFLSHAYPLIFQKPDAGASRNPGDGWVRVFESVVGDDIVNQDRYAELPLHSVLRWITKKVKENAKRS